MAGYRPCEGLTVRLQPLKVLNGELKMKSAPSSLNIIDTLFLFDVLGWIKEVLGQQSTFDYSESLAALEVGRRKHGFRPAEATLAVAAVDPLSEQQRRFTDALVRRKIIVQSVDYRHAYVSNPRAFLGDRPDRPISSVAAQLSYVIGLLAARKDPEVVVVSGAFELFKPLSDFVQVRGGKAAIAFFRQFLDPRWGSVGLFDASFPIMWIDLGDSAESLLGVDLRNEKTLTGRGPEGLAEI